MAFTSRDFTTSLRTRGQSSLWRPEDFGLVGEVTVEEEEVEEEEEKRRLRKAEREESVRDLEREDFSCSWGARLDVAVVPAAAEDLDDDAVVFFAYFVGTRGRGMLISV